jgi:Protein SCAI
VPVENGILGRRENPHKYLLYKPTLPQLQVFLASGYKGTQSYIFYSFYTIYKMIILKKRSFVLTGDADREG